ncbi:MAG TPA: B12-binding domain-containing radical SAM protein [Desulfomonilaceae bacterium]|nr:B12-binding domain-containing radical SAM protein [Desulfomonilaceae bacterium]
MKVLLVNPRYPQTFWSFNKALRMLNKKCVQPPLGLLTVAALLPREWDLRLADVTVRNISEADWDHAELVLVTGMINQYSGIMETIREAKKRGKTVVVGGPTVFHVPQDALDAGADIVVRGEAESAVPRLLQALSRRESGILIEAEGRPDLSESPPPRYDLLDLNVYVDMAIQFSRGCPFQCEFCDITLMYGRAVRTKSPEQILQELQILYDLGWRRVVFFVDDNFIGNPSRSKALLRKLVPWMEERGNPFEFSTQASVNLAAEPELLDLMVRAGFWKVFLGIETPDKDNLKEAKKFQNTAVDLDEVCQKINRAGLQIIAGCILGFDHERAGADQRLIDFAAKNNIPEMFVTLLQAGPGTELWLRLEREGRLLFAGFSDNLGSQTGLINFLPTRPRREIATEFIRLYRQLYEPEFYLKRTFEHLSAMKGQLPKKPFALPYISELRAVFITLFRQGIVSPSRLTFWKFFCKALFTFPDRFRYFLSACIVAEHYYEYCGTIQKELEAQLADVPLSENGKCGQTTLKPEHG